MQCNESLDEIEVSITKNLLQPSRWMDLHADYLYNYALTRIDDEEQACDLVQETFLAALEKAESFEGASSERTWLTAILRNKVIDVYRKKSLYVFQSNEVTSKEPEDFFDSVTGHWNEAHQPKLLDVEDSNPLENKELANILRRCMKKLPSLWYSVFRMRHMDEETTATICRELNVSASNFWVIIHRTKVNLRACLQKTGCNMSKQTTNLEKIKNDCKQATFLIEKKQLAPITALENW